MGDAVGSAFLLFSAGSLGETGSLFPSPGYLYLLFLLLVKLHGLLYILTKIDSAIESTIDFGLNYIQNVC